MTKHTIDHAGTHYVMYVSEFDNDDLLVAVETEGGSLYGQWAVLPPGSVAWSYVIEKMPGLAKYPGDRTGYRLLFLEAGITVFNA